MSDLPVGWAMAEIDDLSVKCLQRKPDFDEKITYIDIGSIDRIEKKIITPQILLGKDAPSRARKIVNEGDILVSLTRPNLNAVALVSRELDGQFASTGFEVIKPVGVDSRYMFALVNSHDFINSITKKVQGALYPAAKSIDVRGYKVPLPPLNEQVRIANKLDSLLSKLEVVQKCLDKIHTILIRFRQSVLAAAVSGELTAGWRKKNETEDINLLINELNGRKKDLLKVRIKKGMEQKITLYDLPKNWSWINNHKLAQDKSTSICAGPFGTIFKAKDFREKGIPIIFLRHVKEFKFNQSKPKFMDKDVWNEFHQDYSIYGGELLVTKLGDPPGECCIYPSDQGVSMVTPDVLKMNVDNEAVDTKYLMYFFNSPLCKKMIRDLAFGVTRLRIDIPMFKSFPIPSPPRKEQREITRQVEILFKLADKIEQQYKSSKKRTDKLTQSILAKAFRGELVPQDPTDEPASELLKLIQAVKETQPKSRSKTVKAKPSA